MGAINADLFLKRRLNIVVTMEGLWCKYILILRKGE